MATLLKLMVVEVAVVLLLRAFIKQLSSPVLCLPWVVCTHDDQHLNGMF
jgi:hypothetical protein